MTIGKIHPTIKLLLRERQTSQHKPIKLCHDSSGQHKSYTTVSFFKKKHFVKSIKTSWFVIVKFSLIPSFFSGGIFIRNYPLNHKAVEYQGNYTDLYIFLSSQDLKSPVAYKFVPGYPFWRSTTRPKSFQLYCSGSIYYTQPRQIRMGTINLMRSEWIFLHI